jgi:hypothetical protein
MSFPTLRAFKRQREDEETELDRAIGNPDILFLIQSFAEPAQRPHLSAHQPILQRHSRLMRHTRLRDLTWEAERELDQYLETMASSPTSRVVRDNILANKDLVVRARALTMSSDVFRLGKWVDEGRIIHHPPILRMISEVGIFAASDDFMHFAQTDYTVDFVGTLPWSKIAASGSNVTRVMAVFEMSNNGELSLNVSVKLFLADHRWVDHAIAGRYERLLRRPRYLQRLEAIARAVRQCSVTYAAEVDRPLQTAIAEAVQIAIRLGMKRGDPENAIEATGERIQKSMQDQSDRENEERVLSSRSQVLALYEEAEAIVMRDMYDPDVEEEEAEEMQW